MNVLELTKLYVSYQKDVPDISNCKTVYEIVNVIKKKFKYAEIYLINGIPYCFYNEFDQKAIDNITTILNEQISKSLYNSFNNLIYPIIERNNWFISRSWCGEPVLIEYIDGEWDNVDDCKKDYFQIEFLSHYLLYHSGLIDKELNLTSEVNRSLSSDNFSILIGWICKYIEFKKL